MKHPLLSLFLLFYPLLLTAQVGSHRNEFAVGVNGGYVLSNVGSVSYKHIILRLNCVLYTLGGGFFC